MDFISSRALNDPLLPMQQNLNSSPTIDLNYSYVSFFRLNVDLPDLPCAAPVKFKTLQSILFLDGDPSPYTFPVWLLNELFPD